MTNLASNELFSLATLLYVRLRRVSGRVIDVLYVSENQDYAWHVVAVARATQDAELTRLAARLEELLEQDLPVPMLSEAVEPVVEKSKVAPTSVRFASATSSTLNEVSEEEIYRAQVSHHYIGSLR